MAKTKGGVLIPFEKCCGKPAWNCYCALRNAEETAGDDEARHSFDRGGVGQSAAPKPAAPKPAARGRARTDAVGRGFDRDMLSSEPSAGGFTRAGVNPEGEDDEEGDFDRSATALLRKMDLLPPPDTLDRVVNARRKELKAKRHLRGRVVRPPGGSHDLLTIPTIDWTAP
jgi:hypothetical protein